MELEPANLPFQSRRTPSVGITYRREPESGPWRRPNVRSWKVRKSGLAGKEGYIEGSGDRGRSAWGIHPAAPPRIRGPARTWPMIRVDWVDLPGIFPFLNIWRLPVLRGHGCAVVMEASGGLRGSWCGCLRREPRRSASADPGSLPRVFPKKWEGLDEMGWPVRQRGEKRELLEAPAGAASLGTLQHEGSTEPRPINAAAGPFVVEPWSHGAPLALREICAMQMRDRRRAVPVQSPDRCGPSRRDNKHLIVRVQRGMLDMLRVGSRALEHCECNGPWCRRFRGSAFSSALAWCNVSLSARDSDRCHRAHNEGQRNNGGGLSATDLRQSLRIASICSLAIVQR